MRRISLMTLAIIIAVCTVIIAPSPALAETEAQPLPQNCATYELTHNDQTSIYEVCFVSHDVQDYRWIYSITELAPDPSISHWTLYMCPGTEVTYAGGPCGVTWSTGTAQNGMYFIKFENIPESFESGEFWFVLSDDYGEGGVAVSVNTDGDVVTHIITGPDCEVPPVPEATTTVLLGLGAVALGVFVWMRNRSNRETEFVSAA